MIAQIVLLWCAASVLMLALYNLAKFVVRRRR